MSPRLSDVTAAAFEGDDLNVQEWDGLVSALATASLPKLTALFFYAVGISAKALRALGQSTSLPALRELCLEYSGSLDHEGLLAIIESPLLERLETLALDSGLKDDPAQTIKALATAKNTGRLRVLSLRGNKLTAQPLKPLLDSALLSHLIDLNLGGGFENDNELGNEGAIALASSSRCENLQTLDLTANGIGDEGAQALAASTHLGHLRRLRLEENDLSPKGWAAIKKRFGEKALFEDADD
jgi:hypothetical protein